jgi:hypothetical protein
LLRTSAMFGAMNTCAGSWLKVLLLRKTSWRGSSSASGPRVVAHPHGKIIGRTTAVPVNNVIDPSHCSVVQEIPSITVRNFIITFRTVRHWSSSWASWIQSTTSQHIWYPFYYYCSCIPYTVQIVSFIHSFAAKVCMHFDPIRATCYAHHIFLELITLKYSVRSTTY